MKYAIVLLIFLVSSCKGKTNNQLPKNELIIKTEQNFSEGLKEEKITDEELREFLYKFKDAVVNKQIDKIAEMVHFPLDGYAIYYMVYGDIIFEKGLDSFINILVKKCLRGFFIDTET